jgi:hypothetical protein
MWRKSNLPDSGLTIKIVAIFFTMLCALMIGFLLGA